MKNLISPFEPFYCKWRGVVTKLKIEAVDVETNVENDSNGLEEIILKCVRVPIDNSEIGLYNEIEHKEEQAMNVEIGGCPLYQLNNWQSGIGLKTKEKTMELSKAYNFNNKCDEDRRAIELGALTEDGLLTCEGKDLLLNILLSDPKIRGQFDEVLKDLDNKED